MKQIMPQGFPLIRFRQLIVGFIAVPLSGLALDCQATPSGDKSPIKPGTYAVNVEWCSVNRRSPSSPDNKVEGAFINVTNSRILISEGIAEILSTTAKGGNVSYNVRYSMEGIESRIQLHFRKLSDVSFIYDGAKYYRCKRYLPNPWFE